MARGQLFRLVRWLFETGAVEKGDTLLDPFGGISTTAIAGTSAGLKVVTCELEERFYRLGLDNMEIHRRVWEAAGDPQPTCLLGDSRRLAEVAGPVLAQCVLSSPPYAGSITAGGDQFGLLHGIKNGGGLEARNDKGSIGVSSKEYGTTPGQLGAMPPGNLPPGDALASGVVSSPPYESSMESGDKKAHIDFSKCSDGRKVPKLTAGWQGQRSESYGLSEGQMGLESGETFWSAAKQIVFQCHLLLKPGATTCWVVKSYVKAGKIVPFPDQWAALLEATGFRVTHRIRCHLVSETREADLFGGETVKRKERKSFFRRLHEKKSPHTRIDFEEIVVAVKVGEGGSAGAVVSSPPYISGGNHPDQTGAYNTNGRGQVGGGSPTKETAGYGKTAGQLGGMAPGSPPENPASRNGGEVVG